LIIVARIQRLYWLLLLSCLTPIALGADYLGNGACAGCHVQQQDDWLNSHHDLAMQTVSEQTVLGDFNDARFQYGETITRFFRRDTEFWVETDNADGELEAFKVAYVFGVYPLQQLLLPLSGGRLQALSIAWDSRPTAQGGQRWYHIYADQAPITADDPLHWTGPYHNWNTRCAECHSTNVRKNYSADTRRFDTRYDQIDVGCEACHGPGSQHVERAQLGDLEGIAHGGFAMSLAGRGTWRWTEGEAIAQRQSALENNAQIDNCGRCHARRSTLGDYHYGADLLDTHRLATLRSPLYWPDGQINDEVYVYGSFIQSKMHQADVVCTNCHNPHSNTLLAKGNGLCAQCHQPAVYDQKQHHRHSPASPGAQCVECHMPSQVYMGVDARRDHSMRIPRPDLSLTTGSPNACTQCHQDQSASWALDALKKWGIHFTDQRNHPARAFHSAQRGDVRALTSLKAIIDNNDATAILRASAIEHYGQFSPPDLSRTAAMILTSEDALLRASAVRSTSALAPQQRYLLLRTLIDDPILGVRMAVAEALAGTPRGALRGKDIAPLDALLAEYETVQSAHLDMPSVQLQLANVWISQGKTSQAESALKEALRINPQFVAARLNLSDLFRQTDREEQARALLVKGIKLTPEVGALQHSLGLLEIRAGNIDSALVHLEAAASEEAGESRHRYVYAIALHDTGKLEQALTVLERLNTDLPGNPEVLYALIGYAKALGDGAKAGRYSAQLQAIVQTAGLR